MKLKVINKLLDAGFDDEKKVMAFGMRDMLICEIKGEEIGVVLELQDATKSHKVISFLADRKEELKQKPEKEEAASEAAEEKEDTVTENYTFGGYYEEQ